MKTVILKWNPTISSYSVRHFMDSMNKMRQTDYAYYDWSVWDWEQIHKGDHFYWIKVGSYGQTGIVGCGEIETNPWKGRDWSGQERETRYVRFVPEVLINPDALPILTCEELRREIPDFDWQKGHSGLVLTGEQATQLDALWNKYLQCNEAIFNEALERSCNGDILYIKRDPRTKVQKEQLRFISDEQMCEKIKGWNKIVKLVDGEMDCFNLHDASLERMNYDRERQQVDLYLYDMWNKANIHLRFTDVIEVDWDSETGSNDFAWEYNLKISDNGKYLEFRLDETYIEIICSQMEVVSVKHKILMD